MQATNYGRPTTPSEPHFHPGEKVEVKIFELGFDGVWFEAVVLSAGPRQGSVEVRFEYGLNFCSCYRYLAKAVDASCFWPRPTRAEPEEFCPGEAVEVFSKSGWHAANMAGRFEGGYYAIVFPDGSRIKVSSEGLRRRVDWVDGEWVAPAPPSLWEEESPSKPVVTTNKASTPANKALALTSQTIRKGGRPLGSTNKLKRIVFSSEKGMKIYQEKALIEAMIIQNAEECSKLTGAVDDINNCLKELEDRVYFLHSRKSEVMRSKEVCECMKSKLEGKLQILQDKSNDIRNSFG